LAYMTLMVHLQPGHSNAGLLKIVGDLSESFDARVIGIVACRPVQFVYSQGYVPGDLIDQNWKQLEKEIKEAETEFRSVLQTRAGTLEWRSKMAFDSLSEYIAREARCADLIITSPRRSGRSGQAQT
jgi:hypothetical protein